ncbi:three-helix bundle dimerization domain-containing protein [Nocardia lasii]|uniref:Three-helix bundle dimerization domain-containing protein n=1 Tax=Nocardia lasii TaxID=1616107 RepID=A0ABW1JPD1_9NOCA
MATDEAQQIEAVVQRLAQRYPSIPFEDVEDAVYLAYGTFDDARVRDFIPLLVERRATRALATAPHPALVEPAPQPIVAPVDAVEHRPAPSLTSTA